MGAEPPVAIPGNALSLLVERPRFAVYLACRFLSMLAWQIVSVTVGWLIYEKTGDPRALGFVGLVQFLPALFFSVPGGIAADRYDRRNVLAVCYVGLVFVAAALGWVGLRATFDTRMYYALLGLLGVARAFSAPAGQAIIPALVPRDRLAQAVSLGSVLSQSAFLLGPTLAGLLLYRLEKLHAGYGAYAFVVSAGLFAIVVLMLAAVPALQVSSGEAPGLKKVAEGLQFVFGNKPILGALSLDLFAVLLGGVTALLPVFAKTVLDRGPWTFGLLRAAPGAGALLMALVLLFARVRRRAGLVMFASVFVYGIATLVFAYSSDLWLSLGALVIVGASDMVSVVIRSTLIQLWSPDSMRGRVSAVNLVFITSSNELGEFESGTTAKWLGPRQAAALGGLGTCLVVLGWMKLFPALRETDSLEAQRTL